MNMNVEELRAFFARRVVGRRIEYFEEVESTNSEALRLALELSLIHISEPTRLLSISYAVFCLKKKKQKNIDN